ncbi:hypothetical protein B0T26DRAFT_37839 [Lasiosphaeria miniovina]|uniref:Uncharacterized protein n=1 Tax=Lasiosphaeria miniovina TaxID=1954250 RepID=A0AA40EFZ0_9PEZI|nr:uncharacterized protein B0T26DRAFT_37839 [Lasiosphaeria miniovina]KAK0733818.1 hypothetical protein B0T26DRAFT_37839 [Lasiosphaeria miniovina]
MLLTGVKIMSSANTPAGTYTPRGFPLSAQKTRQVWTQEEDRLLSSAVAKEAPKHGSISWHRVAAYLPGRNNKDCRKRWHYSIANTIRKGTWTREEDQKLREAVEVHGARWSKIAEAVGTRNGDQCWKRWYDCLDPRIDKSPWTPEEDARLLEQVAECGRNWTEIVNKHFANRTSLSAKNRFSILQRRRQDRSTLSPSPSLSSTANTTGSFSPAATGPAITTRLLSSHMTDSDPANMFDRLMIMGSFNDVDLGEQPQTSLADSCSWYCADGAFSISKRSTPELAAGTTTMMIPDNAHNYQWASNPASAWGSPSFRAHDGFGTDGSNPVALTAMNSPPYNPGLMALETSGAPSYSISSDCYSSHGRYDARGPLSSMYDGSLLGPQTSYTSW